MQIDLFTLIAQVINLIILLFLLRKFLYLPVLKAVETRQKAVADELSEAMETKQKALREAAKVTKQIQEIETQKQQIMAQTQAEAEEFAATLSLKAEQKFKQEQQQWKNRLSAEQKNFDLAVQQAAAEYFNLFAQKALRQIADADLNKLAAKNLLRQINELSPAKNKEYAAAFRQKKQVNIQSAAPLEEDVAAEIETFLRRKWELPTTLKFGYETKPELICGICIVSEEQLVAWNFQDYLQEFKQNMHNTVQQLLNRGEK